jgi:type IV pilus assembly protein PilY1
LTSFFDHWFYEVDAFSGSRLDFSVFDVNGDGLFNGDDFIEVEVAGEKIRIPSSGLDLEMGIVNQPVVSTGSDGAEFRIFSGSNSRQGAGDDENEDFDTRKAPGALELGRQNWEQIR